MRPLDLRRMFGKLQFDEVSPPDYAKPRLPEAARRYLPGTFAIPVAVFAAGVLLVALAGRLARWRTGYSSAGLRKGQG